MGTIDRALGILPVRCLVSQNDAQQGAVHSDVAIVVDEAELPNLVHEEADSLAAGTNRNYRFGVSTLLLVVLLATAALFYISG
jgi:hypothetical protein